MTFFNAWSDWETGSPMVTKYRAYTRGDNGQANINFDSQLIVHNGSQYYFRGFSVWDSTLTPPNIGKDTFWVKAASNGPDSFTNTRADMYVSGRVGVGTSNPQYQLHVLKANAGALGPEIKLENSGAAVGDAEALSFASNAVNRAQIRSTVEPNTAAGTLEFSTGLTTLTERMRITGDGRVSIGGNPNPAAALDVTGSIRASVDVSASNSVTIGVTPNDQTVRLIVHGGVVVDGNLAAKYQDVAEWVPAREAMRPGTVVILNPDKSNEVQPSTTAYDTSVAGVVSSRPGLILGEAAPSKELIATTGRVKVRVDASRSPIRIGDLLVTSDKVGFAMRSEPIDIGGRKFHQPGTVIGKALEPLGSGEGEILVLLSLQ